MGRLLHSRSYTSYASHTSYQRGARATRPRGSHAARPHAARFWSNGSPVPLSEGAGYPCFTPPEFLRDVTLAPQTWRQSATPPLLLRESPNITRSATVTSHDIMRIWSGLFYLTIAIDRDLKRRSKPSGRLPHTRPYTSHSSHTSHWRGTRPRVGVPRRPAPMARSATAGTSACGQLGSLISKG